MGKTKNRAVYAIQNDLCSLLEQLINQWETGHELYHTSLVLSKNIGNLRLMQVFSEQFKSLPQQKQCTAYQRHSFAAAPAYADAEASFIYEKTGSRFRHFLIDEFQDTSGFQWDNFKPLLENALGEGNYNLLVGDVKQAIYRWRSGDWQLLQKKVRAQLSHTRVALHSLQDNRRSAKPVISFNNFLYKAAPGLLQAELNAAMAEAPSAIYDQLVRDGFNGILEEAYAESFQHVPENASSNGQVEIRFYEIPEADNLQNDNGEVSPADEEDAENYLHRQLYNKICALLVEGFMAKDIAILTRKNKEATDIITSLMNFQQEGGRQFELLSAEALLLTNNNAVSIIIQAMEVLAAMEVNWLGTFAPNSSPCKKGGSFFRLRPVYQ
jgi:ATP-dependent exoDNAse (exonuclease V) beta subunit